MNTPDVPASPGVGEIADLVAWARRLSETGTDTDPGERAAFLAAKTELLARIAAANSGKDDTR